jgi:histidinol-phosphate aminotransferase
MQPVSTKLAFTTQKQTSMKYNRRTWLKQASLGLAGIGLSQYKSLAGVPPPLPPDTIVRLSSNENPYGPSPKALEAMLQYHRNSNRYNWNLGTELLEKLARKNGVTPDMLLLGAGSTELLDLVARYAANVSGNFVIADPSYDYWTVTALNSGLKAVRVPLDRDRRIELNAMFQAINKKTRLIYICNPNNPTGTLCPREDLVHFIQKVPAQVLVLVDEAYLDYTTETSLIPLCSTHPNVVVLKTFSKIHGLAGARIGYAVAHKNTMEKIAGLQSWNNGSISLTSVAAALATVDDELFLRESFTKNESVRQYTFEQLIKSGLNPIQSSTNFIYFSLENYTKDYFQILKTGLIEGTRIYESSGQWTRITIGTRAEMEHFFSVL